MTIDLGAFSELRPYLFHLTAAENLPRIRRTRVLESTAALVQRANRPELLDVKRRSHVRLTIDGDEVILRDQAPLHAGNILFNDDCTFAQFVGQLNARVFFWPGDEDGPIPYGLRHFARYESESPAILRVSFTGLMTANPGLNPLFCRYNSGSPRWSRGAAAPRGAATFVPAAEASFRLSEVVEVTALNLVQLPDDTLWSERLSRPWKSLF
jgi:hypothetical protein